MYNSRTMTWSTSSTSPSSLKPPPHKNALFSLVPINNEARAAITLPENAALRAELDDRVFALTIDLTDEVKEYPVLATIGQSNTDIVLPKLSGPSIQCYFKLHPDYNGYIMLHDKSKWHTTQVSGDGVLSFQPGRPRQIVIQQGENMVLGMGRRYDLYEFAVVMHEKVDDIEYRLSSMGLQPGSPTASSGCTSNGSSWSTLWSKMISTRKRNDRIRYVFAGLVGRGSYGRVDKCVDVDSGKLMAVKTIPGTDYPCVELDREIAILKSVCHPNIVEFLGSQEGRFSDMEIFMGLKDGNVDDLVSLKPRPLNLGKNVLIQILRALEYLDSMSLIHRDVKPGNILYSWQPDGSLQYSLADFGLANWVDNSFTHCGTNLFRAPEISKDLEHTAKVDVWSLFVTYLWVANTGGFRVATKHLRECRSIWAEVRRACNAKGVSKTLSTIRDMGAEDPDERLSASDALDLFELKESGLA